MKGHVLAIIVAGTLGGPVVASEAATDQGFGQPYLSEDGIERAHAMKTMTRGERSLGRALVPEVAQAAPARPAWTAEHSRGKAVMHDRAWYGEPYRDEGGTGELR